MKFEKWPHFFVLMGLSALAAGVGHHYDDQNEWLLISRMLMLFSLFYAVWASRVLFDLRSVWFSPGLNIGLFSFLGAALLYQNAFWPVIVGVIACFGICVPSGLQHQNQWSTRTGKEMITGIALHVIGGLWFGLQPFGDLVLDRHLAHVPVSAGTLLIGMSISHFRDNESITLAE